jgi:hypothetical protein
VAARSGRYSRAGHTAIIYRQAILSLVGAKKCRVENPVAGLSGTGDGPVYLICAIFPWENHVNSTGKTNRVRKVAVTRPPTMTLARGF